MLGAGVWLSVWIVGFGLEAFAFPGCAANPELWATQVRGDSIGALVLLCVVCFVGALLVSATIVTVTKYGRVRVVLPLVLASGWAAASWFLPIASVNFIISEQIDPQCATSMTPAVASYLVAGLVVAAVSPLVAGVLLALDAVRARRSS